MAIRCSTCHNEAMYLPEEPPGMAFHCFPCGKPLYHANSLYDDHPESHWPFWVGIGIAMLAGAAMGFIAGASCATP